MLKIITVIFGDNEIGDGNNRSGKSSKSNILIGNCSNLTKSKKCLNLTISKNLIKSNYIVSRSNFLNLNIRITFIQLK